MTLAMDHADGLARSQYARLTRIADDYVTKPFEMSELLARLRAAVRRYEGNIIIGRPSRVVIGRWRVDLASHRITHQDATAPSNDVEMLGLTPIEWAIEENPARPRHLLTVRGMGYRYQP